MTAYHKQLIKCNCGESVSIDLYDSVNVDISPNLKRKVEKRSINSLHCKKCGLHIPLIKQFLYVDMKNNQWVWCYPDMELKEQESIKEEIDRDDKLQKMYGLLHQMSNVQPKVVFGYSELLRTINNDEEIFNKDNTDTQSKKEIVFSGEEYVELMKIVDTFISSSKVERNPKFVIVAGGAGSGKTTMIKEKYHKGFVLIDAARIHMALTEYETKGVAKYEPSLDFIGMTLVSTAICEKRNIVIEIIGDKAEPIKTVIDAIIQKGYTIQFQFIECDPAEAYKRSLKKDKHDISAVHTQDQTLSWFIRYLKR